MAARAPASGVSPAARCASAVKYDGHFYVSGGQTSRRPSRPTDLGQAVYPACNDTGCATDEPDVPTVVWALRGADPQQVVVGRTQGGHGASAVFGRLNADPKDYFRQSHNGTWQLRRP